MRNRASTGWEQWGGWKGEELRLGEEKHVAASPSPMEFEEKKDDC